MPAYHPNLRDYSTDLLQIESFLLSSIYTKQKNQDYEKYSIQFWNICRREQKTFCVWLDDLNEFDNSLVHAIQNNLIRYRQLFSTVLDKFFEQAAETIILPIDTLDCYLKHVRIMNSRRQMTNLKDQLPKELFRRFNVSFIGRSNNLINSVRMVKSPLIGQLILIHALVTRVSEVKPWLSVATYTCDRCGGDMYQRILTHTFTPLITCSNTSCGKSGPTLKRGNLIFQGRGSKFIQFQEIKVQEIGNQIPPGSVPRILTIWCLEEQTRRVKPGDSIQAWGVYMPIPKTPSLQFMQGLLTDAIFWAQYIDPMLPPMQLEITTSDLEATTNMSLYEKLWKSIAPEIYGHEDLKKAIALLLVGGTRPEKKNFKIRSEINICIVGDPGVAKSQILAYISRIVPSGQYVSGRGSSSAGLTASVVRDPVTHESTLEGGSLVLADGGFCCIDEFDKMQDHDRTAIHEVMEQQSISIAKAGIQTTLNARVSILAAANPIYSVYRSDRSLEQNVGLSAALLSRFDLIWLIRDQVDMIKDVKLAQHVLRTHQGQREHDSIINEHKAILGIETIRNLIKKCSLIQPKISKDESVQFLIDAYVQLRSESRDIVTEYNRKSQKSSDLFVSPRALSSIVRLSGAHAKLRNSLLIERIDLEEAVRLIDASKRSILANDTSPKFVPNPHQLANSKMDGIFLLLLQLLPHKRTAYSGETPDSQTGFVSLDEALTYCCSRGYSASEVTEAINEYDNLGILQKSCDETSISLT